MLKQYRWNFVIAEVSRPLLGANFLQANSLDLKGKCLVDAETYFSSQIYEAGTQVPHLNTISQPRNDYDQLISNFPEITIPNFATTLTKHGVEHFIKSTGLPINVHVRRLPPDRVAIAKAEFLKMEAMGII